MTPRGLLRVLIVFHEAQALGASTSVLRVTDELALLGWSASGWLPGTGPLSEEARRRLVSLHAADRPFAFSGRGWREAPGPLARLRDTPAYLRAFRTTLLRTRPHVVHANTLLCVPEALVAHRCGVPVVVQSHELPEPSAKRTATVRAAARAADVLVGVSDAVSAMLQAQAGRTPVHTVRNGVPPVSPIEPPPERPFTVGTIGTVSRVKGTDVFYETAAAVLAQRPGVRFEHVGADDLHHDRGLDEELAATRATLPAGAVHALGAIASAERLPHWDAYLSTSRSEAFPLSILEAMAQGLPIVATRVGGVPEQIVDGETGLLAGSEDCQALAAAIVRLHDDAQLRRRLGTAAMTHVRSERTLAGQAAGLHAAYLTALDIRFGPPRVRRALRRGVSPLERLPSNLGAGRAGGRFRDSRDSGSASADSESGEETT